MGSSYTVVPTKIAYHGGLTRSCFLAFNSSSFNNASFTPASLNMPSVVSYSGIHTQVMGLSTGCRISRPGVLKVTPIEFAPLFSQLFPKYFH